MAGRCSICSHPRREEIDIAVLRGVNLDTIAERFGTSRSAVSRHHRAGHVGQRELFPVSDPEIARSVERARKAILDEFVSAEHFAVQFGAIRSELEGMAEAARKKSTKERLSIIDRRTKLLEIQGRLLATLAEIKHGSDGDTVEIEYREVG